MERAREGSREVYSETLRPRLQALMTPWMNEGFFADVVVLVRARRIERQFSVSQIPWVMILTV